MNSTRADEPLSAWRTPTKYTGGLRSIVPDDVPLHGNPLDFVLYLELRSIVPEMMMMMMNI